MGDLSPHFSRSEFRDHDDGTLPPDYPDPELVQVLERIRSLRNQPVHIVSGYRSPKHNKRVGGAVRSQHLVGKAADLRRGVCTIEQAIRCGARGIGHCDGWVVHVDVRRASSPVIFRDC